MTDREFWIQIRRGLIIMLDAIDHKFALNSVRPSAPPSLNIRPALRQPSPERIESDGIRNR